MHARHGGWALLAVLAGSSLLAAAPALAHANNNHGTIKVHDELGVEPPQQNNPHVTCDFFIVGTNMSGGNGTIVFEKIPPSANPPVVTLVVNWSADSGSVEEGFEFTEGPFNFTVTEKTHFRVEVFVNEGGPPGNQDHSAKSKVFWVHPCEGEDVPPPDGDGPECPDDVTATATADGDITLSWTFDGDADSFLIYRGTDADSLDFLATVDGETTTFTDTDVEVGVEYFYQVTAVVDGDESEDCEVVSAIPIPFFPTAVAGVMALAGGTAGYVVLRRRR